MVIKDIFENKIERHIDPVVEIGGETDASRLYWWEFRRFI